MLAARTDKKLSQIESTQTDTATVMRLVVMDGVTVGGGYFSSLFTITTKLLEKV